MPKETEEVASKIVDAAIAVHRALGPGLLESVYEVCLLHELNKRGLKREGSTPQTFGNVLSSHWIPAFAGMTGGSRGSPFQMTPAPANCPVIAWCLGVLVLKGFEGIPAIDPLIH